MVQKKALKENPKVTVVIPTYNRASLIQQSIKSVLAQTYKNLEVIIVDDSNDNTEEKVKEINDERLVYIKNQNRMGVSFARNMAIERAKGELIAFQDSDDAWYPEKLEKQVNLLLNSESDVVGIYCGMALFDAVTGKKTGEELTDIDFAKAYTVTGHLQTPSTQTVLIMKSVLDEVGYFDKNLSAAEDTELAIRVSRNNYKYGFVNEPLIKVVQNHDSLMGNAMNYLFAYDYIYEKHNDYLHPNILFGLAKMLANYYILKGDIPKAKLNVKRSLKQKTNFNTLLQFVGINLAPSLLRSAYQKKYKEGIPHPVQKGKFIEENRKDY